MGIYEIVRAGALCMCNVSLPVSKRVEGGAGGGYAGASNPSRVEPPNEVQIPLEVLLKTSDSYTVRKYSGVVLSILGGFCFTVASFIVKRLNKECDPIFLTAWRYCVFFVLSIPLWCYNGVLHKDIFGSIWPMWGRESEGNLKTFGFIWMAGFFSSTANLLIVASLSHMALVDSTVVLFCAPVFSLVFGHIFLKESCGFFSIPVAILTFAGVFVINKPPILTGTTEFHGKTMLGTGMCLGALLCLSLYSALMTKLREVQITLNSVISAICGLIQSGLIAQMLGTFDLPKGQQEVFWAITMSVIAFVGQISLILALKFETASNVSLFRACDVVFAIILGMLFLHEVPDQYSLIGVGLVLVGVVLITFRKWVSTLPKEGNATRRRFRFILM